nr:PREDICTED: CMP-N-acetylneuraminate-beta-galactosamide-alpha-2,3-sialyltransferase 4 [Latimeria chalumnae]|eukprot:XP_014341137.1 PREDICTED: CMP-N-acetylneuraminate-beta-galactosamide-alpha-2,3-sialyltransferase 4 [Latimeria chalumnae]
MALVLELFLTRILAKASNYEMPEDIESLPCKTCVVVGNGYIIKNSSLGNEIDKYDVVIRLNSGPVRGYEKDVGTKTTMRLFYPESAILDTYKHDTSDTLEVFVPYKENDLRWLKSNLYNEQRGMGYFFVSRLLDQWCPKFWPWEGHINSLKTIVRPLGAAGRSVGEKLGAAGESTLPFLSSLPAHSAKMIMATATGGNKQLIVKMLQDFCALPAAYWWAGLKQMVGRIWPVGHTLDITVLDYLPTMKTNQKQ